MQLDRSARLANSGTQEALRAPKVRDHSPVPPKPLLGLGAAAAGANLQDAGFRNWRSECARA
eukprot:8324425-Pyramimonas_sp.AAC.1